MTTTFRILISTGEVSGDLQGSLLIRALQAEAAKRSLNLTFDALGGPRMAESGANLIANTAGIGAIGLFEALPYVPAAWSIQQRLYRHIKTAPPDLTVLIDYVGFNLTLAKHLKRTTSRPVFYYIAPQEWVWTFGKGTTRKIVQSTDQILAIFPQEAEYYAAHGASVIWVGHPFVDTLAQGPSRQEARQQLGIPDSQTAIALLPASRRQELQCIWPVLAQAAQQLQYCLPEVHFWIPVAQPTFRAEFQNTIAQLGLNATLTDASQLSLAAADLAIGKSGTANLEAALLQVPQIVVYRVHPLSGWLYRTLLRFQVAYISPVNLVSNAAVIPELLQDAVTPDAITQLAIKLLQPSTERNSMLEQYRSLRQKLGEPGVLERASRAILNHLEKNHLEKAPRDESSYRD